MEVPKVSVLMPLGTPIACVHPRQRKGFVPCSVGERDMAITAIGGQGGLDIRWRRSDLRCCTPYKHKNCGGGRGSLRIASQLLTG
jgi:hypothetical protein